MSGLRVQRRRRRSGWSAVRGALAALAVAGLVMACGGQGPAPGSADWTSPSSAASPQPRPGQSPTPTQAPAPTATPTATPASTQPGPLPTIPAADTGPWVTFVSKQHGYSLQHPESWSAERGEKEDRFLIMYGSGGTLLMGGSRLTVRRGDIGRGDTLGDVVRAVIKARAEEFGCEATTEPLKVDGWPAKLVLCTDGDGLFGAYDVVVVKGSDFYLLVLTFDRFAGGLFGMPDDLEVLRKVAASFEFR